jgi:hypothetical protein
MGLKFQNPIASSKIRIFEKQAQIRDSRGQIYLKSFIFLILETKFFSPKRGTNDSKEQFFDSRILKVSASNLQIGSNKRAIKMQYFSCF